MPKFKLKWREEVIQYWEVEVEAENEEEAEQIFYDGNHLTVADGNETVTDTDWLESSFEGVEPLTHQCDDCGKYLTEQEYNDGQGLCYDCIDKIN